MVAIADPSASALYRPGVVRPGLSDAVHHSGRDIGMAAMTIYAAHRSLRLPVWLSRDGDSIVLALPGPKELKFEEAASGSSDGPNWKMLEP
jgi:hypothetical protein